LPELRIGALEAEQREPCDADSSSLGDQPLDELMVGEPDFPSIACR
jgi:hypothetical protein